MTIDRVRRLAEAARSAGMDAVALMPGANLQYLLGLTLHQSERIALAVIYTDSATCRIVLPHLEHPRAASEYSGGVPVEWFTWNDDEGPRQALRLTVDGLIGRTVGVEFEVMRVLELRALEEAAGIHSVDVSDTIATLRMRKDATEIALMREAVRIVEAGLSVALEALRPGRTERELATIWEEAMRAEGSNGPAFATIVAAGPHSANPHHTTGDRVIEAGDLVIFDGGARYNGYCSDITRTVMVGQPSDAQRRIYAAVEAANQAGFAAARPGATGRDIDRAARAVIEEAGLGEYFVHRTGHGLGMEIHEPPYMTGTSVAPLGAGSTFTVEPGVYVAGVGGVRIEDDVVLTDDGAERLTTMDRALRVIE